MPGGSTGDIPWHGHSFNGWAWIWGECGRAKGYHESMGSTLARVPGEEERIHVVDGLRTFSRVVGEGPDVVLVHGAGVSSRYWLPAQRLLAAAGPFRVHALDFPGFGQSQNPDWPPELPRLARHLAHWLDAVGIHQCSLVGQSVGCEISVLTTAFRRTQVERLVLAAPSGLPHLDSLTAQLFAAAVDAPREPLLVFGAILPDYFRCGPQRLLRILAEQLKCPAEVLLPGIQQPVLVLRGERDTVVTEARVRATAAALPHARTVTVPGAHAAHLSHPEAFVEGIAPFLKEWPRQK